ncbi:hypothetical protein GLAREA_00089 [Glarea lozoyensis ATCC 20868]|uniref:Uncharacterized protein n=1 Tax=Glarea lozoyensis (strain ATCC 20868 / MF5171) TaxID=1116229 RepID=S3DAD5_GLAL2|nr:uncharacterized protein GLAREA_00089 [Glarea lozoyensis ATCC 20868]EPE28931.1 hypothetical protein GLAREA_00089 [Glarea lozoyensis ATCC 20868]
MFWSIQYAATLFFLLLLSHSTIAAPTSISSSFIKRQDPAVTSLVNMLIEDLSNSTNEITVRVGRIVEISRDPAIQDKRTPIGPVCDDIFLIVAPTGFLRRKLVEVTVGSSNHDDAIFSNLEISRHGVIDTSGRAIDVTPSTVDVTDESFYGKIKALEGTPNAAVDFARLTDQAFFNTVTQMGVIWNDRMVPSVEGLMNAASLASGQGGDLPPLIRADID